MFVQSHTDATLGYVDQLQDQAFDTLKGTHAAAAAAGAAAAGHAEPAAATVAGALAKSILQCAPLVGPTGSHRLGCAQTLSAAQSLSDARCHPAFAAARI
jgi:hypothetical protein